MFSFMAILIVLSTPAVLTSGIETNQSLAGEIDQF